MSIGSTSILAAFRPVDNRPCCLFHPMARERIRFDQRLADPLTPLHKKNGGYLPYHEGVPAVMPRQGRKSPPSVGREAAIPPSVAYKAFVDAVQVTLMIAAEIRAGRRRTAADAPAVLLEGAFAPGAGTGA